MGTVDAKREVLHSVCASLLNRGYSVSKAAEILDIPETQVHSYLASSHGAEKVETAMRAAALAKLAGAAERSPCFDQVLQVLVPKFEDRLGTLELAVLDKRHQSLGFVRVLLSDIIGAPDMRMEIPSVAAGQDPLVIVGDLLLRWLV